MTHPTHLVIAMTAVAVALAGCQTMPAQPTAGNCKPLPGTEQVNPTTSALIGGAIGALAGGAIGRSAASSKSVGTRNGALFGAIAGALAGTAYAKSVNVTESADGSVKLDVPGSVLFPSGSSQLGPDFKQTLNSVAGTINEYCGVTAKVVGHTDNVGSYPINKALSDNRAQAVVSYLATQGVSTSRLVAEGVADTQPIASNADANGRQLNRRVEVFVRPPAP